MRRFALPVMLVVSLGVLGAALSLVGVPNLELLKWSLAVVGLGVVAYVYWGFGAEPLVVDPWKCGSCGETEEVYTRQCGSCHAHRAVRLRTKRLLLREWTDFDLGTFAALNADPRVMEYQPGPLTREESDAFADRIREGFEKHGVGLWAVEIPDVAPFIGYVGLSVPSFEAPFSPCVEVDCRLAFEHWNQGYATEGAMAALEFGFREIRLKEVVSFTVPNNIRGRRVMEKIGMKRDPAQDFEHPNLAAGHRLRPHVLYRAARSKWLSMMAGKSRIDGMTWSASPSGAPPSLR